MDQQLNTNDSSQQGAVQKSASEVVAETVAVLGSMGQVAESLQMLYGAEIYYVHPVGMAPVPLEEALQDLASSGVGEEQLIEAYEVVAAQFAAERHLLAEEVTQDTGRPIDPDNLEAIDEVLPDETKEQSGNNKDADWGIAASARFSAAFNIPNPDPGLTEQSGTPAEVKPAGLKNRLSWASGLLPQPILKRYLKQEEDQSPDAVVEVNQTESGEFTPWLEPPKIDVDGEDWINMQKVDRALARYQDPVKALNYIHDMLKISKAELLKIMARVTKACREQKIQSPQITEKVGKINANYLARRDEILEGEEIITGVYDYFFPGANGKTA